MNQFLTDSTRGAEICCTEGFTFHNEKYTPSYEGGGTQLWEILLVQGEAIDSLHFTIFLYVILGLRISDQGANLINVFER